MISLLLPTRGRPDSVRRLFASIVETTSQLDDVEVILYVDEDDLPSQSLTADRFRVETIIGPAATMGHYNMVCLKRARGTIMVLANDDMVIRTAGWDSEIRKVDLLHPDKVYLAYCNDLFKNRGWCTFPILSRSTCELLGEPYPTTYRGAFIDTHLVDLFKRLEKMGHSRIHYLDHVVFEHLHYRVGKSDYDDTYRKRGRFQDDATIVAHSSYRRSAAQRLDLAIHGDATSPPIDVVAGSATPGSLPLAMLFFTRTFLLDLSLPLRWRTFLWYWFIGRCLAARGLLGSTRR